MVDASGPLAEFLASSRLTPHGFCLLWKPELIWTHVLSDLLIGLAYMSIPLAMAVFLSRRRDVRFGWVIWLFVAFIMLCGFTHFMSIWVLWHADYAPEAVLKVVTALVSVVTATALWPLLPRIIAIPSADLLEARIQERDQAMAELRTAMADMVEMREHERRQKLLLDELNHRVKNTLTVVQAIASQTLTAASDPATASRTFIERLGALSKTHNLLVGATWQSASFRELVDGALGHFDRPYSYEGPDLELAPSFAVTLGMALHELATNAVKYGAWSGNGSITILVECGDQMGDPLSIIWLEQGGPPVATPIRNGFGARLLNSGVALELNGEVALKYLPDGLKCSILAAVSARMRPA